MDEVGKNTVLIVDDEKLNIIALSEILSPEYVVYAVMDGKDAIEKAEKYLPDIILLDIIMPDMDGYAVINALKKSEKTRNIPVIFVTGLRFDEREAQGLTLGAADYITKPFDPVNIRLRVRNQMRIINQVRLIIEKEVVEKSNQAKFEFLSSMSHEMITPMNIIVGMTNIAKNSDDARLVADCLNEIETASQHLLRLIRGLLNASQ